nr:cytochrome P450 CYP736A12-like [Ipomoea batatas]GME14093.1 cytochrome P450 CYP736A12-like [Ipomoea batatas]
MSSVGLALLSIFLGTLWWIFRHRRAAESPKSGRKLPPGPQPLPIIGNLHQLGTLPHRSLNELSKTYGPIMYLKLGKVPLVVVSSPAAAELILKTHDAVFASRPKNDAVDNIADGSKGMAFAPFGPHWRGNKKFATQELLTTAKIESFAAMRREEMVAWVKSIEAAAGGKEAVDLTAEGLNKRLRALGKSVDKLFLEIIKEHEQDAKNGVQKSNKDIVDMMLASQKNPSSSHKLDLASIKALLFDMIVGSVDTSYAWIEWTLAEIMRNPRVMKLLQEELENKVGLNRMVEEKDLPNLEYLEMVIKESFRLHPVATLLVPRESLEDIELNGHFIPKKSRVMINCWAIGHDPNIWSENVEQFFPERFMSKSVDIRGHDFHLLPFGYGRRVCPGVNLGLINVKLIVGQLMHCFNWELPNKMSPHELDMTETFGLASPKVQHLVAVPSYRLLC